ncbi:MAG: low temperature requirement protein A, partial [Micrococcaceae bacterium]|nr:low temperature requirement protein A [Micrococcaceae bacterium]
QTQALDIPLITGGLLGVAAIAAMWWAYFVGDDDLAAKHFAAASGPRQSWMARIGYDISHLLMIIGIIGVAAGIRLDLGQLSSPAPVVSAWLVGGGVAVYLGATGLFRWALQVGPARVRLIAAAGCLGTVPGGGGLGTAQQRGAVAAITVVAIAAGRRRRSTTAGTPGRPRGVVP